MLAVVTLILACAQTTAAARQTTNLFGGQLTTGRSLISAPFDTISPVNYGISSGGYGFGGYGLPGYGGYGGLAIESAMPPMTAPAPAPAPAPGLLPEMAPPAEQAPTLSTIPEPLL